MFAVDRTARWVVSGAHGSRLAAKYGTLHAAAATFNEGRSERGREVPSGSLRVAAAAAGAEAAEWMDGLCIGMEGRVAPLTATYGLAHAHLSRRGGREH